MTERRHAAELDRLEAVMGEQLGFAFEHDRRKELEVAASARSTELGLNGLGAYLERLESPAFRREETARLAEAVTVTETFFFRNPDQLSALVEAVLPERARRGGQRLRILCAGCASGEEPYSLAMALREGVPDLDSWNVQILAIDVNPAMLAKAKRATFTPWSLRATPEPLRARYFKRSGNALELDPEVTKMVTFRAHNLAEHDPLFYRALACDAIFCRNVIMYFTPEVMGRVVGRLTEALLPGGFLFLGHAETLRGLSHDYHLCHTHETFYYQRKEPGVPQSVRFAPQHPLPAPATDELPPVVAENLSWFEAIQRATHRVTELTAGDARRSATTAEGPAAADARALELAPVLELMRRERFAEARALLDALPADAGKHPDALLFSAVLLTNDGKLADAERACERLLEVDELHAGAHYLKALCREHAGDTRGALEHDEVAVHLDPTFAMPHLHAGLMARRAGDALVARRELGQAQVLLEREDTSRLVLFGGGFSRDALAALCRTELGKLGGRA
ncbi:MAG TPA: CheR family methyltransferase [Polyangiaceae bacterium]|nr:CheR family methyltransferase [Polyangiaceae bacterium]